MNRCAFLSMDNLQEFECYDHLLFKPFNEAGWQVDTVSWRNKKVYWDDYDAVIIRSCWDYQKEPDAFLEVLKNIDASAARLANSLKAVQWNIDKTYLKALGEKGLPVVHTRWRHQFNHKNLPEYFSAFKTEEIIIKPLIGANADDTFRLNKNDSKQPLTLLEKAFKNSSFLVQPFLKSVIETGEFSLFFFYDSYSHTILKTPASGDFRVQEEHGGTLKKIKPDKQLLRAANKVMNDLPEKPLYARLDFVKNNGTFLLIEAELIEPSLYFNMDSRSPRRFTEAFQKWWKASGVSQR